MTSMTKFTALLAAMGPLLAFSMALPADIDVQPAQPLAPEKGPNVVSISFSGSGCPQGSSNKVSGDGLDNLSVRFDKFTAVSPGTKRTTNCQVHVNTDGASSGWQMALSDIWIAGKGRLASGSTLKYYTTTFYSQEADKTLTLSGQLTNDKNGVLEAPITIHSTPGNNAALWGPCTTEGGSAGILNVNFRVALPADSENRFEVGTERWALKWRRC